MWKVSCFIALVVFVVPASAQNLLTNGDWATGDETGWTRWWASWGGTDDTWSVTSTGPTAPEGTLNLSGGGSFGWYQYIDVPTDHDVIVDASWEGDISPGTNGWCEVMLFSVTVYAGTPEMVSRIDVGDVADIAFKKDTWGENPPTTWSWESASGSPHLGGSGAGIKSLGRIVVATKLGGNPGDGNWARYDNITLIDLDRGAPTKVESDWKKYP